MSTFVGSKPNGRHCIILRQLRRIIRIPMWRSLSQSMAIKVDFIIKKHILKLLFWVCIIHKNDRGLGKLMIDNIFDREYIIPFLPFLF